MSMFLDHDLNLLSTSTSGTDAADLMCEPEASTGAMSVSQLRQFRLVVFPESMEMREVGVRFWKTVGVTGKAEGAVRMLPKSWRPRAQHYASTYNAW